MQDKQLWASLPIWYDQSDPPARACWLYAMQLAQELRSLKVKLPRAVVPPAGGGPCIHMRASQAVAEQQAVLSGPHKRQRTTNQQEMRLAAQPTTHSKPEQRSRQMCPAFQITKSSCALDSSLQMSPAAVPCRQSAKARNPEPVLASTQRHWERV